MGFSCYNAPASVITLFSFFLFFPFHLSVSCNQQGYNQERDNQAGCTFSIWGVSKDTVWMNFLIFQVFDIFCPNLPHLDFHFRIVNWVISKNMQQNHCPNQCYYSVCVRSTYKPRGLLSRGLTLLLLLSKPLLLQFYSSYFSSFLRGFTLMKPDVDVDVVDKFQTPKFTCPNLHQSACPCPDMFSCNCDALSST